MKVNIIGAGLAGLLAGNMLRHRSMIFEKQDKLPNNHHALLRFRSGIFGTALGIPFKKVRMVKAVYGDNSNPIANELKYSKKTTGQYRTDRSLPVGVVKEDRYVAPPDLIQQMATVCGIEYGKDVCDWICKAIPSDPPFISTIPMPILMKVLDYPRRKEVSFGSLEGDVISADIKDCDCYATYYFPQDEFALYRASITGSKFILESTRVPNHEPEMIQSVTAYYARTFGIPLSAISNIQWHHMKYAKILPIDDDIRKDFMHWATVNFNIYSLGRYATWRPGLLLDDLVNDVTLISKWIQKGGRYNAAKHSIS